MRLTNGGEIGAFFLARAIVVAIIFVATRMFLGALYLQVFRSGGAIAMTAATLTVGLVGWLLTLLLLVLFRAGFGSVPPTVAADRSAVTTSGGEVGAFLLTYVGVAVIVSVFNALVLGQVYGWLRTNGHADLIILVSLGISAVTAVIFLPIFVALRGAMAGSAPAAGAGVWDRQPSIRSFCACSFRRTGVHPRSSRGQAFAGTRASVGASRRPRARRSRDTWRTTAAPGS